MAYSDFYDYGGLPRHKYGNSEVYYDTDGRMPEQQYASFPRRYNRNQGVFYPARRDYRSFDPRRQGYQGREDVIRTPGSIRFDRDRARELAAVHSIDMSYGRQMPAQLPRTQTSFSTTRPQIAVAPMPLRREGDWSHPVVGDARGLDGAVIMNRNNNFYVPHKRRTIVQRYRVSYSVDSPLGAIFIVNGILLLICAIVNVILCTTYHYYCGFWTGILVLEFGVLGLLHRGDYNSRWKNYAYIVMGVLTTIAVFASIGIVFSTLVPNIRFLTIANSTQEYFNMMRLVPTAPHVDIGVQQRSWLCLAFDIAFIVILMFDALVLIATMFVANSYWNVNHRVVKECDPWCKPKWFNPFGQFPLGQAVIFMGLLSVWACTGNHWHTYWSPVWAGILILVGASLAVAAVKQPDHTTLTMLGVVFQIIALAATIATVAICILGMADNIDTLNKAGTNADKMLRNPLIGSACVYALAAVVALLGAIFCLALIILLFMQCSRAGGYYDDYDYGYDDESQAGSGYYDRRDRPHYSDGSPYDRYSTDGYFERGGFR